MHVDSPTLSALIGAFVTLIVTIISAILTINIQALDQTKPTQNI